ncbi:MAG TPA: polysaccharide deacetylase family protein [Bryobacteraceae bacterium]|nr:polysaccharide deacetylase family protein [Bryobacteraceae bacterium]
MRVISLAYHDVIEDMPGSCADPRPHSSRYTLSRSSFRKHLEILAANATPPRVSTIDNIEQDGHSLPVFLTFDDGAAGAYTCIADELERLGWRGHFFIVSSWIGRPGFMDRQQICDLRRRGHIIGSHSRSHPERMSCLEWDHLVYEWIDSCAVLSDLLGEKITVASVPNGYHSADVARSAALAGIQTLFTSEATTAIHKVDGCDVLGRFCVQSAAQPSFTAALVTHRHMRMRQTVSWNARKVAKAIGGNAYLAVRSKLLS